MSEITFTHIRDDHAAMVDISEKDVVCRRAVATGRIWLRRGTVAAIQAGSVEKGNVLATARVAAITAIKETSRIIPMCHQIPITGIDVDFEVVGGGGGDADGQEVTNAITAIVVVSSVGRTGVEMEALCGVSVALLTIWDMVKSAEKDESGNYPDTGISSIRVLEKVKY
ncbi:MAG: cyclic pyranopterin monophosphate synthase MoaC [Methanosarcinales archaeon]|nr:MAG: cyclic pyranopterin monophosphate synthase MoaC [Methanosarcinales archaeon]